MPFAFAMTFITPRRTYSEHTPKPRRQCGSHSVPHGSHVAGETPRYGSRTLQSHYRRDRVQHSSSRAATQVGSGGIVALSMLRGSVRRHGTTCSTVSRGRGGARDTQAGGSNRRSRNAPEPETREPDAPAIPITAAPATCFGLQAKPTPLPALPLHNQVYTTASLQVGETCPKPRVFSDGPSGDAKSGQRFRWVRNLGSPLDTGMHFARDDPNHVGPWCEHYRPGGK